MLRRRVRGGLSEQDRPVAPARGPAAEPVAPPTPAEEAALIADRLGALVEQRRAGANAPIRPASAAVLGAGLGVGARHSGRLLGNLLVTRGFIVEAELNYALARQASTGDPIGRILVDLGLITDRDLVELLAEQLRMEVVDPARITCDPSVLALLSSSEARARAALPIRRAGALIEVAMAEPTDDRAVAELMELLGAPLRLLLATRADIEAAVERCYS